MQSEVNKGRARRKMTSSQVSDDDSLSNMEFLRGGDDDATSSNMGAAGILSSLSPLTLPSPRTPVPAIETSASGADAGATTTPSRVLIGKFNELDNLWNIQKTKSIDSSTQQQEKLHQSNRKNSLGESGSHIGENPIVGDPSSGSQTSSIASALHLQDASSGDSTSASRTSSKVSSLSARQALIQTPTGPLLDKLHSLEQTWSGTRSVPSKRSSGSSSLASSSYSSKKRRQQQPQQQQRPISLMIPTFTKAEDHGEPANDEPPTTAKAGNIRRHLFASPTNQGNHRHKKNEDGDDDIDNTSNSSSVGESTISTVTSSESVFDRLYRLSFEKKNKKKANTSNSRKQTATAQRVVSYTPKTHHRSRDRLRAFQDTTRSLTGGGGSVRSSASTSKKSYRSIHTAPQSGRDSSSVFARLHRNEKRTETLWTSPPQRPPVTPPRTTRRQKRSGDGGDLHDASSMTATQLSSRSTPDSKCDDDSVFARLHRNEKRKEKLWKASPTSTPNSSFKRNSLAETKKISSAATKTTTLDEDLEAIEALGKDLDAIKRSQEQDRLSLPSNDGARMTSPIGLAVMATIPSKEEEEEEEVESSDLKGKKLVDESEYLSSNKFMSPSHDADDAVAQTTIATVTTATSTNMDLDWLSSKEEWSTSVDSVLRKPSADVATARSANLGLTREAEGSQQISSSVRSGFFTLEHGQVSSSASSLLVSDPESMGDPSLLATETQSSEMQPQGHGIIDNEHPENSQQQDRLQPSSSCSHDVISPLANDVTPIPSIALSPEEILQRQEKEKPSAIVIQKYWRCHRGEIALASKLLQTTRVRFKFADSSLDYHSGLRIAAINQAIQEVDCWWILEGLLLEDEHVNIAWENEIQVFLDTSLSGTMGDDKIQARVSLDVEGRNSVVTNAWSRHKLATIFVKAGLERSLDMERQRAPKHAATLIQHEWYKFRQRLQQRQQLEQQGSPDEGKDQKTTTPRNKQSRISSPSIMQGRVQAQAKVEQDKGHSGERLQLECEEPEAENNLACADQPGDDEFFDAVEYDVPTENGTHTSILASQLSAREHKAAATIQNWLRISGLKSVIQDSPEPKVEFERALVVRASSFGDSPKSNMTAASERDDMLQIRRRGLSLSDSFPWPTNGILSDPFQDCPPFSELVEQRASALAIHNIIRAYLMALRKYRRIKKAILIQTAWRRHQAQHASGRRRFAAIVIQTAWANYTLAMIRKRSATLIQRRWRTIWSEGHLQTIKFTATSIQTVARRWIVAKRYQKLRTAILTLQSVVRASPCREAYLKNRFAAVTIQRNYRHRLLKRHTAAAIILQSAWRSSVSQQKLQTSIFAMVLIQSTMRRYFAVGKYSIKRNAVGVIQKAWRGYHSARLLLRRDAAALIIESLFRRILAKHEKERRLYFLVKLQNVVRMFLTRRRSRSLLICVSKIQALGLCYVYRQHFQRLRVAAVKLQSSWRRSYQKRRFETHLFAICTLQKIIRGYRCRLHYALQRKSAIKIQTEIRCCLQQKRFVATSVLLFKQDFSVRKIQRCFQRYMVRQHALQLRSTIKIQSLFRAFHARKRLAEKRDAAIIVAAMVRGRHTRSQVQRWSSAAIRLQCIWRIRSAACLVAELRHEGTLRENYAVQIQGFWRGRRQLQEYRRSVEAAVCIQCSWRGASSRDTLLRSRLAAVLIQSVFRSKAVHNRMVLLHLSSLQIQHCWRMHIATEQANRLRQADRSIRKIQRIWQRTSARRSCAARRVQSIWLGHSARNRYLQKRESIVVIQKLWRAGTARESTYRARDSIVLIQATLRGHSYRTELNARRHACIKIQRCWHDYQQRITILHLQEERNVSAAICIQRYWRGEKVRDIASRNRVMAIILQSTARGFLVRQRIHHRGNASGIIEVQPIEEANAHGIHLTPEFSVVSIQRLIRGALVRQDLATRNAAAVTIQCAWVAFYLQMAFVASEAAAVVIQSACRKHLAVLKTRQLKLTLQKLQCDAAVMIQSAWRRYLQRKNATYSHVVNEVQRVWRGSRSRNDYSRLRISAIMIQSAIRRNHLAIVAAREVLTASDQPILDGSKAKSALILQRNWRAKMGRSNYLSLRQSATRVQALVRQVLLSSRYHNMLSASVKLQTWVRRILSQRLYGRSKSAIIGIQAHWRASKVQSGFMTAKYSAIALQSICRGNICRSVIRREMLAALVIQSVWRRILEKKKMARKLCSIHRIQRWWRLQQIRLELGREQSLRMASATVQRYARGYLERRFLDVRVRKAVVIQSSWRRTNAENVYMQNRASVIMLQSGIRGFITRKCTARLLSNRLRAAIVLQRATRCRKLRVQEKEVGAAITIQATWRMRICHKAFAKKSKASLCLQSHFRMWLASQHLVRCVLACRSIQAAIRVWCERRHFLVARRAAIKIQRIWRGALIRQRFEIYRVCGKYLPFTALFFYKNEITDSFVASPPL